MPGRQDLWRHEGIRIMNPSYLYTVSEFTQVIKECLERDFPFLWIRGQVGTISRPSSGHIYLTLKDTQASLQVVWFKPFHHAQTGLSPEKLSEGMEIICAGRITVYPPRGSYQLVAELIQDQGLGQLYLEYEALKQKLLEQGYFDQDRKQTIPSNPVRIAVLTSPSGAAIHDFLRLSQDRGWEQVFRIYPVLVQGQGAEQSIVNKLQQVNQDQWAQVIIIIRGGGSLEDLWTFNTEQIAKGIYESLIPVVTGIGHETDLTIADLTADLRAATPSHAAQLLWTERSQLSQQLDDLELDLKKSWTALSLNKAASLNQWEKAMSWLSPDTKLSHIEAHLVLLTRQLVLHRSHVLQYTQERLQRAQQELTRVSPLKPCDFKMEYLYSLSSRLQTGIKHSLDLKGQSYSGLKRALQQSDPHLPLSKGYSLVTVQATQEILRSSRQVRSLDLLDIQTYEDHISAQVVEADD
jgi:exodeoxyribonuclease VII large subunit